MNNQSITNYITIKPVKFYLCDNNFMKCFINYLHLNKGSNVSSATTSDEILIYHLEDWVNLILTDRSNIGKYVSDNVDLVLELIEKSKVIIQSNHQLTQSIVQLNKLKDEYKALLELYSIFVMELKKIQIISLERYNGLANHRPRLFIPFSSTLNRLATESITIFTKGSDNIISSTSYSFTDKLNRIDKNGDVLDYSPRIQFCLLDINYINSEFRELPDVWKYYKTKAEYGRLTNESVKRLDLVADIYNYYKTNFEHDDKYYISYPFALPYVNNTISDFHITGVNNSTSQNLSILL